jgi:hypothetical protein
VLADFGRKLLAPNNRGIVLDLAIFLAGLFLVRALVILANGVVRAASQDFRAQVAVGLFFAALLIIQPLGPVLKRWSFHQRNTFDTDSGAGCFLFWFMVPYLVMLFVLCGTAAVVLEPLFFGSPAAASIGIVLAVAGFAWSIVGAVSVYRYFVTPKAPPRWAFLTTPAAAHLGDAFIVLNALGLQILWSTVTASGTFREVVTQTPLGRPGSFSDILGRLIVIAVCAVLLYLPARIFYLAEDKHRALTAATILLANLPLIVRIAFAPAVHT